MALPFFLSAIASAQAPDMEFLSRAKALSQTIEEKFWDPERHLYHAYVTESGEVAKEPAFAWDMAVQLSGLGAAARIDPSTYGPFFSRADVQAMSTYGSTYLGIFGYAVLPVDPAHLDSKSDRFYDDNCWIALSQLDGYEATRNPRYLAEAKATFKFVMSGEDSQLGGGLYWREQEKTSKNTCSNAPAIAAAARLYLDTKDTAYLDAAVRLHNWIERLKDSDNLMFDAIGLDGNVAKTKWTYNTALMIRGDVHLYKATHKAIYRDEAVSMGSAAVDHWVDPTTGAIKDESSFAHHLAEAFLDLGEIDHSKPWRSIALKAIDFAAKNAGQGGLYGLRWDKYEIREHRLILLYQGSMARGLWLAAKAESKRD